MLTALVTGSAGFVGRHMSAALTARGWHVIGCDPAHPWSPAADALNIFREDHTRRFDLVVHAAAVSPHRAAIDGVPLNLARNLMLDASLFTWAVRTGQPRIVYLSSSAAYPVALQDGQQSHALREDDIQHDAGIVPDAAYGWTKLTGEKMAAAAAEAGVAVHVVRPFSGYGEDQGENWPFGAFIGRAVRKEDPFVIWGTGDQVRDWIHIDDVVGAILAMVDQDVRGPMNLATGLGCSMLDIATLACKEAGHSPHFQRLPDKPAGVMYRVGDPTLLRTVYRTKVSIFEGIRRAVAAAQSATGASTAEPAGAAAGSQGG